ncbi:hypothetical protein WA026_022972 [Henosepilachna vigintioctopunctata]|uniref:Uncharacterized protein n=1 Tax=Henosepilachna vigintioctopunctata TaxID=420089 RepID=A0AAW1TRY6_9CUCU
MPSPRPWFQELQPPTKVREVREWTFNQQLSKLGSSNFKMKCANCVVRTIAHSAVLHSANYSQCPELISTIWCDNEDLSTEESGVEQPSREVELLRIENKLLVKLLNEKDTRISELIKINLLLEEKMNYIGKSESLSNKVDLINREKTGDSVISNQNSSKLSPTLKDKTSDKSHTQSQKNKGENLLTYENKQKQKI